MKVFMILAAALFPFLHETSYDARLTGCSGQEIQIESEGSTFSISLFNTGILEKKGEEKVCSLLEGAKKLRFEIDPSTKIKEPLAVYLFADDTLVQTELMKQGYAYPLIRNPEYTYEAEMEAAYDSTQTMAPEEKKEERTASYPFQGPLFLGIITFVWTALLVILLRGKKRKIIVRKKKNMVK